MNKKNTAITIFFSILLIIIISCSDINPFTAGGVVPGGNWIYFAEGNSIRRMRLDGNEPENVFTVDLDATDMEYITSLQLNPFKQKIYILTNETMNDMTGSITEYNLDGTNKDILASYPMTTIYDIEIDTAGGLLYFANGADIRQIDLATGANDLIYVGAFVASFSMCIDYNGNIYYTNGNPSIYKLNISTGSNSMITPVPALASPGGIIYNQDKDEIYVHDGLSIVRVVGLVSNTIYLSGTLNFQNNMELYRIENKLFNYRTEAMNYELNSVNLDGTGFTTIYSNNFGISAFDILSK